MACKKSELVAGINSYVAARLTGDNPLISAAASMLQPLLDSLDYEPEEEGPEPSGSSEALAAAAEEEV